MSLPASTAFTRLGNAQAGCPSFSRCLLSFFVASRMASAFSETRRAVCASIGFPAAS